MQPVETQRSFLEALRQPRLLAGSIPVSGILLSKMGWLTGLLRHLRAFRDGTSVPKSTASTSLARGFDSRELYFTE